jgi:hypothetical protein
MRDILMMSVVIIPEALVMITITYLAIPITILSGLTV